MKNIILLTMLLSICIPMRTSMANQHIVIHGLFRDMAIVSYEGRRYSLSPGDTLGELIVLVSASSEEAVFNIDGVEHRYALGGHIGSVYAPVSAGITVTIAPDQHGMFYVNGSINRHQTRFMVDTGATLISMNKHHASRFGIDYKLVGERAMSNTAAGPNTVYIVRINSVNVGGIQLDNIAAAVHDGDFPDTVLLGNSFLNKISINRDGELLLLSK
jgi:aspartyl protease family protein